MYIQIFWSGGINDDNQFCQKYGFQLLAIKMIKVCKIYFNFLGKKIFFTFKIVKFIYTNTFTRLFTIQKLALSFGQQKKKRKSPCVSSESLEKDSSPFLKKFTTLCTYASLSSSSSISPGNCERRRLVMAGKSSSSKCACRTDNCP